MVSAETLGNSPWPISEPLLLGTEHKLMTIKTEEGAVGPSVSLSRRVASKEVTMRGGDGDDANTFQPGVLRNNS